MASTIPAPTDALPHQQQMDRIYRTQRHFYDLTRKYYLLGRDRLIDDLHLRDGMTMLEIGCGTGRNLITAARRWNGGLLRGIDISPAMLEQARRSITRNRLDHRIAVIEGDACDFAEHPSFSGQKFHRIALSYTLSMIPAWELAIEEALSALIPGGEMHIVDFGQQEQLPHWFRSMLFGWLRRFHVYPRADMRAVLEEATHRHGRSLHFTARYRGYAWSAIIR